MVELKIEEKSENMWLKVLRYMGNTLVILMIALLVVVIVVFGISLKTGEQPSLFNYKMFIVQSNSMSPEFETGSLLFVSMDIEELTIGDIITYKKEESKVSTTHRIVDIVDDGARLYITRGDANNIDDPLPVVKEDIIGRVSLSIPLAGYVFGFIQSRSGVLLFGLIPSIIIIFIIIKEIMKELDREKISL